jgi:hypothetical protein
MDQQPDVVAEGHFVLANEFAEVVVSKVSTRNGVRLQIRDPKGGRQVLLDPIELEALTWSTPETFSELLKTPHGPEDEEH